MLELTGVASLLRGASMVYWLVALVALFLAIRLPKTKWKKTASAAVVLGLFGYLPGSQFIAAKQREAFAKEAWAYFKKKCETEAGQKIYKTFTDVKSVLVVKPLPAATERDLFDQYWYGDPYSLASSGPNRGVVAARRLIDLLQGVVKRPEEETGFEFVEMRVDGKVERLYPLSAPPFVKKVAAANASSRFGISWEDISTPEDREYWVAGSRLRVLDLSDNAVIAERIGFVIEAGLGSQAGQRLPWLTSSMRPGTTCPQLHDYADRRFVLKALKPSAEKTNGK